MTYHLQTLIEAHGAWLRTFKWDWYFTGTFAKPVTASGARFLLQQYVKSLQQVSGKLVNMYWVVERGPIGGNVHVHGLIGNTGSLAAFCGNEWRYCNSRCGVHLWCAGKAQVSPYRLDGAASFYISKTAFTGEAHQALISYGDWDFIGTPISIPV